MRAAGASNASTPVNLCLLLASCAVGLFLVTGVALCNVDTGERKTLHVDGMFVAIGRTPNTGLFEGRIDLDDAGYVAPQGGARISAPGVFAAGDVEDRVHRQNIVRRRPRLRHVRALPEGRFN